MCLAVPGKVLEVVDPARDLARVEIAGVAREVNLSLLPADERPRAGDWVLVHVGFALNRIDEAEALELLEILEGLTQPPDEVGAVEVSTAT